MQVVNITLIYTTLDNCFMHEYDLYIILTYNLCNFSIYYIALTLFFYFFYKLLKFIEFIFYY